MNVTDVVILVVLALGAVGGVTRGFIVQVAGIFGAVAALAVARAEYTGVRPLFSGLASQSSIWPTVVSYLLVFLIIWAAILIVARRIRGLVRLAGLGLLDRLGGAIIGVLQAVLVLELLLYLGQHVHNSAIRHSIAHSALGPTFLHAIPQLKHLFPRL